MLRITALNEEVSDEESLGSGEVVRTKEAEESEALELYKRGLELLQKRDLDRAIEHFYLTLESSYLENEHVASASQSNQGTGSSAAVLSQCQQLKYACWKNIGGIYLELKKWEEALDSYLEAVDIDREDITIWYNVGNIAIELGNLQFARHAFKQGLECSPNHWPSIDQLITVTFALCDDVECLYYISMGLHKDPYFLRGLVVRDAIFEEMPTLKEDIRCFKGHYWAALFESQVYSQEEADEFLQEVKELRTKHGSVAKSNEAPLIQLAKTVEPNWTSLGESLVATYKYVEKKQPKLKLSYRIEVKLPSLESENRLDSPAAPAVEPTEPGDDRMQVDGENQQDPLPNASQGPSDTEAEAAAKGEEDKTNPGKRKNSVGEAPSELQRRSTRSRANAQQNEEDVTSLRAELRSFLPTSLQLDIADDPSSAPTFVSGSPKKRPRLEDIASLPPLPLAEEEEAVRTFLEEADGSNCGAVGLLMKFCDIVAQLDDYRWDGGLADLYREAYQLSRRHYTLPCAYDDKQSDVLKLAGWRALLHAESLIASLKDASSAPAWFLEDLFFLIHLADRRGLYEDKMAGFQCRVHWVRSQWYSLAGDIEAALYALTLVNDSMNALKHVEDKDHFITRYGDLAVKIFYSDVKSLYDELVRTSQLEDIEHLYQTGQYQDLVDLLKTTFHLNSSNQSIVKLDRPSQLKMLLEGLRHLGEEEEFFRWIERCLEEAVKNLTDSSERPTAWIDFVQFVFNEFDRLPRAHYHAALGVLDRRGTARFAETLVLLCSYQMEVPDSRNAVPLGTTLPWILLHQLIEYEEIKAAERTDGKPEEEKDEDEGLGLSALFLFSAHEMLGKRSWCMANEGRFVLHCLQVYRSRSKDHQAEEITRVIEQLSYCAFGYPSRKSKNRLLQEHSVPSLSLTWSRSLLLAEFYLPDPVKVPEFDSVKPISDELEILLKRILPIVPCELNPVNHEDAILDFINGKTGHLPSGSSRNGFPAAVKDTYYLLADFYFKSKDWIKAVQNYVYDLTINPDRFDSWAAMALAKGSRLETKLNSCERAKNIGVFLDKAEAALRCFRRAIWLRPAHLTLWIEHGSTAYMLHSCYSRLLHHETDTLSIDLFERLEKSREKMLHIAHDCFEAADKAWEKAAIEGEGDQDERWLHHYMLGKVAEKTYQPLAKYLGHYQRAATLLEEAGATYPRRITYNNPPTLSVEALEVYYRIHACVLKLLVTNEGKQLDPETYQVIQTHLATAAEGSFAKGGRRTSTEEEKPGLKRKLSKTDEDPPAKRAPLDPSPREGRAGAIYDVTVLLNEVLERVVTVGKEPIREKSPEEAPIAEKSLEKQPIPEAVDEKPTLIGPEERRKSTTSTATITSTSSSSSDSDSSSSDSDEPVEIEQPKVQNLQPIIESCLNAMKECVNRFPNFYKGLYRMAHYYFHSKKDHNIEACRELLWGRPPSAAVAQLQQQQGMAVPRYLPIGIGGLFCEWRAHNFFNGIWRIPVNEVDRPGCFAAHMGRSISLLLDVLKESCDHRLLLELALALHPEPESDKKYLFDSEREQQASLSLLLLLRMLRNRLQDLVKDKEKFAASNDPALIQNSPTRRLSLLMDVFRTYDRLQRDVPGKESNFTSLLVDCYKLYKDTSSAKENEPPLLEQALTFCRMKQAQSRVRMGGGRGGGSAGVTFTAGRSRRGIGGGRRGRPPGTGRPKDPFPRLPTSVPTPSLPSPAQNLNNTAIIDEALKLLRSTGGSAENLPPHLRNIPGISTLLAMFASPSNRSTSTPKKDTTPAPTTAASSSTTPSASTTAKPPPKPAPVTPQPPAPKPTKSTPSEKPSTSSSTQKEVPKPSSAPAAPTTPKNNLIDPALLSLFGATNPFFSPLGLLGSSPAALGKAAEYQQQMMQWMQAAAAQNMLLSSFSTPRRGGLTAGTTRKSSGRRPGRPPMFPAPNLTPQQLSNIKQSLPLPNIPSSVPKPLTSSQPQPSTSRDASSIPHMPKSASFTSLPKGMPLSSKGKDFRPIKLQALQSTQSKSTTPKQTPPTLSKAPVPRQTTPVTSISRDLTITSVTKSPALPSPQSAPYLGSLPRNPGAKSTSTGGLKSESLKTSRPAALPQQQPAKQKAAVSSALAGLSPAVSIFSQAGTQQALDLRSLSQSSPNLSYSVLKNLSPSMSLLVKPPDPKKQQQQASSSTSRTPKPSSSMNPALGKHSSSLGNLSKFSPAPGTSSKTAPSTSTQYRPSTSAAAMLYSQFSNAISITQKNAPPAAKAKPPPAKPPPKNNKDDDVITLE